MAFDINAFIAQQKVLGQSKPNLFEIYLSAPNVAANIASKGLSRLYCKAGQIPGVSLNYIEVPYQGTRINVPTQRFYNEWTVTIINDRQYALRSILEGWVNSISDSQGKQNRNLQQGILQDMWVVQYSNEIVPLPIQTYFVRDAFPADISPIDIAWDQNDSTQDYTVTFRFQYFDKKNLLNLPVEIIKQVGNIVGQF